MDPQSERLDILQALAALPAHYVALIEAIGAGGDARAAVKDILGCSDAAADHLLMSFRAFTPESQAAYRSEIAELRAR